MDCDAEKLIFAVEQRPAIYNFSLKEHSNRSIVNKLWEEIAEELKCRAQDCRAKWINLRSSYGRCLREKTTASGYSAKKKKKWYLEDAMGFLRDFMHKHKNTETNIVISLPSTPETGGSNSNTDQIEVLELSQHSSTPANDDCASDFVPHKKTVKATAADKIADPMIAFLRSRTNKEDNPNLTFCKGLVPDMDKLSEPYLRRFKREVNKLLMDLLDEQDNAQSTQYYQNSQPFWTQTYNAGASQISPQESSKQSSSMTQLKM